MSRTVLVKNLSRPNPAPARVLFCDSFLPRLRGLMFRSRLSPEEGLLLVQDRDSRLESSIHMLFVPFNLAVFWIDSNFTVVDMVIAQRWRPVYISRLPARYILEVHPARCDEYKPFERVEFLDA